MTSATNLKPLPKGISTWVYSYGVGVVKQVQEHNARAQPHRRFNYLFPYAGALDFPGEKGKVVVHFSSERTRAYAKALPPGTLIMPIVDGRTDEGQFDGWTEEQYREAARQVAEHIIADDDAAGVQIDIEPFRPDHLPFYRHLREMLNAEGKYCTMFVGPRDKDLLRRVFESCDIVVMSGYDLDGEGASLSTYRAALARGVARFQEVAEETGGHYLVGIPASASWGEYEYIAGGEEGRTETGVRQEEYVRAALEVVEPYEQRPQCLGLSLWRMSDPEKEREEPEKAVRPTKFPNIIRESVWKMLEDGP